MSEPQGFLLILFQE